MRPLQSHDLFVAMNIVKTAGIKEEFKKMSLRVANGEKLNVEEIGLEFLFSIFDGCANDKTEKLIYEFLGGILEIEPNDVRVMDPIELFEQIKKLNEVISVEAWKGFFQQLSALIRK